MTSLQVVDDHRETVGIRRHQGHRAGSSFAIEDGQRRIRLTVFDDASVAAVNPGERQQGTQGGAIEQMPVVPGIAASDHERLFFPVMVEEFLRRVRLQEVWEGRQRRGPYRSSPPS